MNGSFYYLNRFLSCSNTSIEFQDLTDSFLFEHPIVLPHDCVDYLKKPFGDYHACT